MWRRRVTRPAIFTRAAPLVLPLLWVIILMLASLFSSWQSEQGHNNDPLRQLSPTLSGAYRSGWMLPANAQDHRVRTFTTLVCIVRRSVEGIYNGKWSSNGFMRDRRGMLRQQEERSQSARIFTQRDRYFGRTASTMLSAVILRCSTTLQSHSAEARHGARLSCLRWNPACPADPYATKTLRLF